jgi:hypothetical protein
MNRHYFSHRLLWLLVLVFFTRPMCGQSPEPVVVQAITPVPTSAVASAVAPNPAAGVQSRSILPLLQEMKAANDEALKKQAATLQTLDELQKAAELIKIYGKRG